jgi:hypothetical protein
MRMASFPLLACALAAVLPQPALGSDAAALVSGAVLDDGRLPLRALGLGDGGLDGSPRSLPPGAGHYVTRGGVAVRAQREGVKLDFPSGAELLVAPDGAVHLRDGSHTAPTSRTLELHLADGARVRLVPGARRRPLDTVEVVEDGWSTELWRRELAMRQRQRAPRPGGACYFAVGRGDVLYRGATLGAVVALQRALCPRDREADYPGHRAVLAGDVLIESLQRLPAAVPPLAVQFPQAPAAAANLASAAPELFPAGAVTRPPGAVGDLIFPLAGDFRLAVEERTGEQLWLALYRGTAAVPVVEWHSGARTVLHLLRPDGGENGGPRYFARGVDVTEEARALLDLPSGPEEQRLARAVLRSLGAKPPARAVPAAASHQR